MSYLVMECHPGFAVVLSDDGRFLKVANLRYEVGQTVADITELQLPLIQAQPIQKKTPRWVSTLAAAAACLMLTVTGLMWSNAPYASVYMAINPEVRIDVNRSDKVVGVEGVNLDGQDLLEGYDHRRKDLETVVDDLVDRAIDQGYLHEGGKITLSLDGDDNWVADHEGNINDHLSSHLDDKLSVTIDVHHKTAETQTVPAYSGGQVTIPVGQETDYGASDYGDRDEGDSGYEPDDDGDSQYDDADDGQTDYDAKSPYDDDEGDTGYGAGSQSVTPPVQNSGSKTDKKESDYDAPEKDSPYEAPEKDSGYEEPDDDDSDYDKKK